jgi:hypothetical protein
MPRGSTAPANHTPVPFNGVLFLRFLNLTEAQRAPPPAAPPGDARAACRGTAVQSLQRPTGARADACFCADGASLHAQRPQRAMNINSAQQRRARARMQAMSFTTAGAVAALGCLLRSPRQLKLAAVRRRPATFFCRLPQDDTSPAAAVPASCACMHD